MNVGVAILRLQEGLDCSAILADIDDVILKNPKKKASRQEGSESSIVNNGSNASTTYPQSDSNSLTGT